MFRNVSPRASFTVNKLVQIRNRGKNYVWLNPSEKDLLVIHDPQPPGVSFKQGSTRIPKWNLGQAVSTKLMDHRHDRISFVIDSP
ncbi:unnamed protein product [Prunus armeniaca]